jgi:hypothetical protein
MPAVTSDGLHDQHTLQQAAVGDRHAEERAIRIFARLRKVLETGMLGRVGEDLWSHLLGHETRQAFGDPHPHAADALRPQADRCGQHEIGSIRLQQVHRAHVGFEPALDQVHDVGQRLRGAPALGNQPADLLERPE